MRKHVKIFLKHYGYGEQDFIPCAICGYLADDIHHICYKSRGGKDEIGNLIALCRPHHQDAHAEKLKEKDLYPLIT